MALCECGELAKPLKVTREDEVPICARCYSPLMDPDVFAKERELALAEEARQAEELSARIQGLLVVTLDFIPGHEVVEYVGNVYATASTTNQATEDKKGIWNTQEKRMAWAVEQATMRLIDKAAALGADAVIGVQVAVNESEGGVSAWRSTGAVLMGSAVTVQKLHKST